MTKFDSRHSPVKALAFCALPCLLSMAAYGAAEKPASVPVLAQVSARGGPASIPSVYVYLHQSRYDGVPGDARARLGACYEHKMQTALQREAK